MTETPRDPDGPDPALVRMLRRRSRKERHGRARGGKAYQSWGEYAPRNLHTTGDTSSTNSWAYIAVVCAAILVPILVIHIANITEGERSGMALADNVVWFISSVLAYSSPVIVFVLLLVVGSRLRVWWETDRHSDERRDTSGEN